MNKFDTKYCKNCHCKFESNLASYCSYCGQERAQRLTLKKLFDHLTNSYFSFDSRLAKTLLPFLFRPGKVAKDYILGKRQSYIDPVPMYVFLSFILFLILSTFYVKKWDSNASELISFSNNGFIIGGSTLDSLKVDSVDQKVINEIDSLSQISEIDSLIEAGKTNEEIFQELNQNQSSGLFAVLKKYQLFSFYNLQRTKGKGAIITFFSQLAIAVLVAVPLYTLLLFVLHLRRKRNFTENLVHSIYLFNFIFFSGIFFIACNLVYPSFEFWATCFLLINPVYFYFSIKNFYDQNFLKAGLKLVLSSFLFIPIVLIMILVMYLLSILQYGQ